MPGFKAKTTELCLKRCMGFKLLNVYYQAIIKSVQRSQFYINHTIQLKWVTVYIQNDAFFSSERIFEKQIKIIYFLNGQ